MNKLCLLCYKTAKRNDQGQALWHSRSSCWLRYLDLISEYQSDCAHSSYSPDPVSCCTGKQQKMAEVPGSLLPIWDTQVEFLPLYFGLVQFLLLKAFGKWASRWKSISLFLSHKYILTKKVICTKIYSWQFVFFFFFTKFLPSFR